VFSAVLRTTTGRRGPTWLTVIALGAAGSTVGLIVAPPAANADPIGSCSTTTGVIVAVDFAAWGGNIERGCDATLSTGYDALHVAGFTTAGDTQDGPTFICRINNEPPPAQENCVATPPAGAYWSYWHADVGQNTWSYSEVGAANYHPPAGSVDAWTFGATDIDGTTGQPSFSPNAVRATNTSVGSDSTTTTTAPSPITTTTSTTPRPSSSAGGGSSAPVRPSSPTTARAGGTATATTPATAPSSTTPAPTTTTMPRRSTPARSGRGNSNPKIVDVQPSAIAKVSSGSPVSVLIGAAAIAALIGAGAVVAWRRRRMS
jgi:hypothetical protein